MVTVSDKQQMRWWLQGFGAGVEVMAPETLRGEFTDEVRRMAWLYATETAAQ